MAARILGKPKEVPDFYSLVPKTIADNLKYRIDLRKRCERDEAFRRAMLTACKHDVLFWMAAFCWVYEPRPKIINGRQQPKTLPMIPWVHQEPVIRTLKDSLGVKDIGAVKSRGEGFSWMAVLLALHDWIFDPQAKVGIVSRGELEADDPENSDSMGWKLDWEISKLPGWMVGKKGVDWDRNRSKHSWSNWRNGSQINADAATGCVFRGGRLKWACMDEFAFFPNGQDSDALASSGGATNSRLFISTVNGTNNEFYNIMHEPSGMVRIVMDWKDNPTRNRGLYRISGGIPVAVDPVDNPLPANYNPPDKEITELFSRLRHKGFVLENAPRSPWYDNECDRPGMTPQRIAQELDRDYGGSMYRVFGVEFMQKAEGSVRPAKVKGELSYHPETLEPEFQTIEGGPLQLWCQLSPTGKPPVHQYAIGCDVSTGLGGSFTSNSVASVIDLMTMEQIAEYSSNTLPQGDFADLAIALAKLFHDAYLAWEIDGPGSAFTKQVKKRGYWNLYYRKIEYKKGAKRTKELGWLTRGNKEMLFDEMLRSIRSGEVKPRSEMLVKEFGQYVRMGPASEITHVLSSSTEDDSSRGKAHGDRVIAFGVALQAARDRPLLSEAVGRAVESATGGNTMAARRREYERLLREKDGDSWDARENADLAAGKA